MEGTIFLTIPVFSVQRSVGLVQTAYLAYHVLTATSSPLDSARLLAFQGVPPVSPAPPAPPALKAFIFLWMSASVVPGDVLFARTAVYARPALQPIGLLMELAR